MAGLNERLTLAIEANDNTSPAIREAIKNVKSLDTQTRRSTQSAMAQTSAMKKLGGAYRSTRMAAQNAAFQIQDIAVQLTAGQAASLVIAQQLPQLISGFGLLGAAIGAVVAIGAGLVRAFSAASESSITLGDRISKTTSIMNALGDSFDMNLGNLDDIKKKFNETSGAVREYATVNALLANLKLGEKLKEQKEELSDIQEDLQNAVAGLSYALTAQPLDLTFIGEDSEALIKKFREKVVNDFGIAEDKVQDVASALSDMNLAFKAFEESDSPDKAKMLGIRLGDISVRLKEIGFINKEFTDFVEQLSKMTDAERAIALTNKQLELTGQILKGQQFDIVVPGAVDKVSEEFEKQAEAIKRARDPLYAYRQDLLELEEAFTKGGLSGESFNILKENLTKTFEEATKQIDPFKKQFEELASTISSGFESSFMSVIDGSKKAGDAFKDFARMVIKQLAKIALQKMVFGPLEQALTGFLGSAVSSTPAPTGTGMFDIPLRAAGGPVLGGKTYIVGEKGPELFSPRSSGQITPNHRMGGSGEQIVINQNINVTTGVQQTVRAEILGLMPQITEASKMAVIDAKRRGGSFAGAF